MANDKQLAKLIAHKARIDGIIARLAAHSEDHFGLTPCNVTWSDVATVNRLANKLESVSDMVFNEGEYA